jgi:hypothetical protein
MEAVVRGGWDGRRGAELPLLTSCAREPSSVALGWSPPLLPLLPARVEEVQTFFPSCFFAVMYGSVSSVLTETKPN